MGTHRTQPVPRGARLVTLSLEALTVALVGAVGVPHALALGLGLRRHPRAADAGVLVGAGLAGWVLLQLPLIGWTSPVQRTFVGVGVAEAVASAIWRGPMPDRPAGLGSGLQFGQGGPCERSTQPADTPPTSARPDGIHLSLTLALTGCGGDGEDDDPVGADPSAAVEADPTGADPTDEDASAAESVDVEELAGEASADATEMAEDMRDNLEDQQAEQGGGSASLTVGDQTWEFDSVLCAIGEEETGQEGAEFVLTSIKDGLQFYVSIDSFGHSVSLNDVEDFEDPAVSLMSVGDDFIEVDDRSVSGQMTMMDDLTMEEFEGSFEGVCP